MIKCLLEYCFFSTNWWNNFLVEGDEMSFLEYGRYLANIFWRKMAGCEFEHTVPTWLSLFRIVAVPIIILIELLVTQVSYIGWVLMTIYIFSCLTDLLDGFLARLVPSWETEFGAYCDQFTDKVFVISIIAWVFYTGRIGYDGIGEWELALILVSILREIVVVFVRIFIKLPSNLLGKLKTTFQMIAIGFIYGRGLFDDFFGLPLHEIGTVLLLFATLFSLWSFVAYAKDATLILWPKLKRGVASLLSVGRDWIMKLPPVNFF